MRFSANLGFLWPELALPDAIRAAARAGFDAVECHWPYAVDPAAVRAALAETGLPMLSLNTEKGDRPDDFGLAALWNCEEKARAAIDRACAYGAEIGAGAVHVMAGVGGDAAVFEDNLGYAAERAAQCGMTVLIEPINPRDKPGYFLASVEQAAAVVAAVARPEVKILFDVYHVQIIGGDLIRRFEAVRDMVGHVQIAAVPSRAEPDEGEIAFDRLLPALVAAGYDGVFGAEYKPRRTTDEGLGWLRTFR